MAEATIDKNAQLRFYKNVRKGYETSGIQLEKPTRIYDVVGPSPIVPRASASPQHYPSSTLPPPGPAPRRSRTSESELSPRRSEERQTKPSTAVSLPVPSTPTSTSVGNHIKHYYNNQNNYYYTP